MDSAEKPIQLAETLEDSTNDPASGILVNASGHPQELDRNFGLLSICGLAITTGNTWLGLGGSIVRFRLAPRNVVYGFNRQQGRCHLEWRATRSHI